MKKVLLMLSLGLFLIGQAQVSKTIAVLSPGTLTTLLTSTEKTTITNLTVTGNIDARDIKCIRDSITNLAVLDISAVSIKGYEGPLGTSLYSTSYSENELPDLSFYNANSKNLFNSISLPNTITSIGIGAFRGCILLTSLTIPNSIITIKPVAFLSCTGLTNIIIPNSVTTIENSVFQSCTGLVSITIPNSVISIGLNIFSGCTRLASISVSSDNPAYSSLGGVLFNKDQTTLIGFPQGKRGSYSIPGTVTTIGKSAFDNCTYLTGITFPNSVALIDSSAFYGCTGLVGTLNLPTSLKNIGDLAFYNCNNISGSLTIPNSVITIGNSAFGFCSGILTYLTIPNSVTSIGGGAFANCSEIIGIVSISNSVITMGENVFMNCNNITGFKVNAGNPAYSDNSGVLFNKNQTTLIQYPIYKSNIYVIPNTVDSIGNSAFYGCNTLTSLTFSNTLKSIGNSAFINCSLLTGILLPNTLKSIGSNAFYNCNSIGNLTFPNSIETIGDNAFLTESSPYTVLTGNITIPNSLISIGNGVFWGCSGITGITIPNSVTKIGQVAFWGCRGLTDVTIPNSVTSLGWGAFSSCYGLMKVTIPNSVTAIGADAFNSCSSLSSIYVYSTTPVELGVNLSTSDNVFYGVNTTTCSLYVPLGSKVLYQAANQWKDFKNIIEMTTAVPSINDASVSLYPNPIKDSFRIRGVEGIITVAITDLNGKTLITKQITDSENIYVGELPKGLYIVKITTKDGTIERKIVKE